MKPKSIFRPEVVILASRFDFTCDYVVSKLRARRIGYLRLNTEDFAQWNLLLDPLTAKLCGRYGSFGFEISPKQLRAVWFRRPVFLRPPLDQLPIELQLSRSQWAAFTRNLTVLGAEKWINHPKATYEAENKALQLAVATRVGFQVPKTIISNSADEVLNFCEEQTIETVAVKGLDTVLLRHGTAETFGFTTLLPACELRGANLDAAPVVVQEALINKLDLRVTVVEDSVYCACVKSGLGTPIEGDWRTKKGDTRFSSMDLPDDVAQLCLRITRELGLRFGAIDLAVVDGRYYFLEINPTGEWAWLVDEAGLPIDDALARALAQA